MRLTWILLLSKMKHKKISLQGTVQTLSGSVYNFYLVDKKWWVQGMNMVSISSQPLSGHIWPIKKPSPWPPVNGEGMSFESIYSRASDPTHPDRMPGGGKHTSNIQSFSLT